MFGRRKAPSRTFSGRNKRKQQLRYDINKKKKTSWLDRFSKYFSSDKHNKFQFLLSLALIVTTLTVYTTSRYSSADGDNNTPSQQQQQGIAQQLGKDSNNNKLLRKSQEDEKPIDITTEQHKVGEEYFVFQSGNKDYDNAYKLAIDEIIMNIEDTDGDGGHFIAGAGWKQLWTRDTSYAVELGAGLLFPQVSKRSLMKCTEKVKLRKTLFTKVAAASDNNEEKNSHNKDDEKEELKPVWVQDRCGHFQGWPNLSDAIVGARGAWFYYLVSGDIDFLVWAYEITMESLQRAENDNLIDKKTGLIMGCSSFMESNSGYPQEYSSDGRLVGLTKALSTNLLYYSGYSLCAEFIMELLKYNYETQGMDNKINPRTAGAQIVQLKEKATNLRTAIRNELWLSKEGYYSYVQDYHQKLFVQMEGLGEALVLLIPGFETDSNRIESIFQNVEIMIQEQNQYHHEQQQANQQHGRPGRRIITNTTNVGGIPCLWPKFTDHKIPATERAIEQNIIAATYHNGNIWPFVQGYWAMAAARHGKLVLFNNEFKKLIQLSQLRNTFAEYYEVSTFGTAKLDNEARPVLEYKKNRYGSNSSHNYFFPERRSRQLWSDTGLIAMVFYGIFGINLRPDGIYFKPVVPSPQQMELNHTTTTTTTSSSSTSSMSLLNFFYRDMTLNIYVSGSGTKLKSFSLDGYKLQEPFIANNITGTHNVEMVIVSS